MCLPETLSEVSRSLQARPEVMAAYLFGSHARGTANAMSDIDIGVLVEESLQPEHPYGYDALLLSELMEVAGDKIDLVVLNTAPTVLKFRVVRDGRLLFEKDKRLTTTFAARTLAEYFDFEPAEAVRRRT